MSIRCFQRQCYSVILIHNAKFYYGTDYISQVLFKWIPWKTEKLALRIFCRRQFLHFSYLKYIQACNLRWDLIVKLESFNNDMKYLETFTGLRLPKSELTPLEVSFYKNSDCTDVVHVTNIYILNFSTH